ncbi:MAG: tetrahydrofolate dehydrogenase/cyclohydrolase catalytic domain-containing protein, partial [Pseudomonadota bacterium]
MTALAATANPEPHNVLRGKPVADEILSDVRSGVSELASAGWPVKLVSMTIGDVPEAALYVRNQARVADRAGIQFEERNF